MSLNWKEIDLVLSELALEDSHIQNVRQPDFRTLCLALYKPGKRYAVLICLETGQTRIHEISDLPPKRNPKPRFVQFLLARLRGARILAARQIGTERILRIDLRRGDVESVLWIRLWGGAANVIVTDSEGTILDAFFRRPKRGETSGGQFWADEADFDRPPKPFEIRDLPGEGSFSRRLETAYASEQIRTERERLSSLVAKRLNQEEERLNRRLERLRERWLEHEARQKEQELGDIIMANLHRITLGDRWLEAERFDSGESIAIPLDPGLEGYANAEVFYNAAKKARSAIAQTRQEIENAERRLAEVAARRQTISDPDITDLSRLEALLAEETEATRELDAGVPGLQFRSGQFRILVGRNARENDELLRRFVKGNDLWLHTRDYAGGFVFVKHISGKSVPLETLLDAGNLAVHYSKGRHAGKVDLYYTQAKHLRRAKGGKKGLVLPTQEKNLTIDVDEARLSTLLGATN